MVAIALIPVPGRHMPIQAQADGVFLARFQVAEHGADGIALAELDGQFLHAARAGGCHVHRRFAGLNLDDVLACLHLVADRNEQVDDSRLGDGLAKLRHDYRNGWHWG